MSQNKNSKKSDKVNPKHKSRALALQVVYQWDMTRQASNEVVSQFMAEQDLTGAKQSYFIKLAEGVFENLDEVDALIATKIDRDKAELNPVELAVLRVAVYELKYCWDVPYRVVINEAIELTKEFGANQGYKYINGVLDKIAPEVREMETKQPRD
ncbi:MAG: transcription antitermination factor NusB [Coxiellaceae bacterium]|nr:transcription antitermination factor NusB [Coxiellaceae bacterium]